MKYEIRVSEHNAVVCRRIVSASAGASKSALKKVLDLEWREVDAVGMAEAMFRGEYGARVRANGVLTFHAAEKRDD